MTRRPAFLHAALGAAVAIAFAAAGIEDAQAAPDAVTYLLAAPQTLPAYAPWVLAQAKGYYADANLKMNFVTAQGGVDVAKQLGAGNAMIGSATGDTSIITRPNGVHVKTVALLGTGQLLLLTVHHGSTANSVQGLKGKTISAMSYGDTTYYALLGSLHGAGLSKADVSIEAAGPAGVWQLFATNKVDAMAAVPDWVVSSEDAGAKTDILPPSPNFQSMAQAIIASDDAITHHADVVQRVVTATLRGVNDIIADPKAAAAAYVKAVPGYAGKEASIERVFELYVKYVYGGARVTGRTDPKRLEAVQNFYVKEGVVPKASALGDLYTNQFATGGNGSSSQ
jgi:NitT/TauT family transport system substrate-binding protein